MIFLERENVVDIKLYVCCHQPFEVPDHPLLVPIQVGAALTDKHFGGFLHDDSGENISEKNRSYCELTAQYWAWKNVRANYYGFFHYRRYLYPDVDFRLPYRLEDKPSLQLLERLGYGTLEGLIERYDLVVPKAENMYVPVREHYANAPFHHGKDLALVEAIIRERYPEYVDAMEAYLSGTLCYFGNICIMKRQVFDEYCTWLFDILAEFDRRADFSGYGTQELRVDGYLAERLLGIYYARHRDELKTLELPRVHFESSPAQLRKKRALNALLPPGSRRRSYIKNLKRR